MSRQLMNKAGETGRDNLIAGVCPPACTTGVTIRKGAAAAVYERGTVMALSDQDGKLVVLGTAADAGETLTPAYVLCDPVEVGTTADVGTAAYRSGCFNTKALIVKDGYTMTDADRDALRKYDIVLNDNMQ